MLERGKERERESGSGRAKNESESTRGNNYFEGKAFAFGG